MKMLDRPGTFMARPMSWGLQKKDTGSVAMVIEFMIMMQHNGESWDDWTGYEDHSITGWFWIVKKDGTVNATQVQALADALGWDGNPASVHSAPPACLVQIDCKYEEWKGEDRLKVQWISHGDRVPGQYNASPQEVDDIAKVFGSLMRGAASASRREPMAIAEPPAGAVAANSPDSDQKDDLPF